MVVRLPSAADVDQAMIRNKRAAGGTLVADAETITRGWAGWRWRGLGLPVGVGVAGWSSRVTARAKHGTRRPWDGQWRSGLG